MNQLIKNNLLGIKELSLEEIELIFETADNFKDVINRPIKKPLLIFFLKTRQEPNCLLSWQKKD
jgi:aspartate carbamoyltransferase catalytic subunit